MKERGSFTLVALILVALIAISAAFIWRVTQTATRYYGFERERILSHHQTDESLAQAFANIVSSTELSTTPLHQIDICTDTSSCLKARIFDATHSQPQWDRLLATHPINLCEGQRRLKTMYSALTCSISSTIQAPGGFIPANLEQLSPVTIQAKQGLITRLLILGSARISELIIDSSRQASRVEIVIAGDAEISKIRFAQAAIPTLIHLVRGYLVIPDESQSTGCGEKQTIRFESNYPILLGGVPLPSSMVGCSFPRDVHLWRTEFLLGRF